MNIKPLLEFCVSWAWIFKTINSIIFTNRRVKCQPRSSLQLYNDTSWCCSSGALARTCDSLSRSLWVCPKIAYQLPKIQWLIHTVCNLFVYLTLVVHTLCLACHSSCVVCDVTSKEQVSKNEINNLFWIRIYAERKSPTRSANYPSSSSRSIVPPAALPFPFLIAVTIPAFFDSNDYESV